jgi:hypothetical protein
VWFRCGLSLAGLRVCGSTMRRGGSLARNGRPHLVADESVNRASPEASESVDGSVDAERSGVMRGGHDPRELARLSAAARRARRRQVQQNPPPTPGWAKGFLINSAGVRRVGP